MTKPMSDEKMTAIETHRRSRYRCIRVRDGSRIVSKCPGFVGGMRRNHQISGDRRQIWVNEIELTQYHFIQKKEMSICIRHKGHPFKSTRIKIRHETQMSMNKWICNTIIRLNTRNQIVYRHMITLFTTPRRKRTMKQITIQRQIWRTTELNMKRHHTSINKNHGQTRKRPDTLWMSWINT